MLSEYQINVLNKLLAEVLQPDHRSVAVFRSLFDEFQNQDKDSKSLVQAGMVVSKAIAGATVAEIFAAISKTEDDLFEFISQKDYAEELYLIELAVGHILIRTLEKRLSMTVQEEIPALLKDCRNRAETSLKEMRKKFD